MAKIPVYVYCYEVIASSVPTVAVGSMLADKRRDLLYVWDMIDTETGEHSCFTGERRSRCCSVCYVTHRLVRDYGHDGEHGRSAQYTPPHRKSAR